MSHSVLLLVPLLVLPVVLLLGFAGCVGEDAVQQAEAQGKEEGQKAAADAAAAQAAQAAAAAAAQKAAAQYDNVILADPNLVAYWRLGELQPDDVTAKDSAPGHLNGEYKNLLGVSRGQAGALSLAKDPNDKAPEFDGVQGFVEVPYQVLLNPPLDFSIEAWARPTGTPPQAEVVLGSYELDASGTCVRGFVLEVVPDATGLLARATLGSGTGSIVVEASFGDGSEHDGWRHMVVTYNTGARSLKLYVNADNGIPRSELPSSTSPAPALYAPNQSTPLRIAAGHADQPTMGTPADFFKGRIDEVALYRATLTGPTIRNHFLAAITP
jgi:hypothetical protein